jgi:hypothetical protein
VPMRYGLTPAELATYLAATGDIDADVRVIPMQGYRGNMWWSDTGLSWVRPSPNIRDTDAALLYPGISFFEATNISEGRGTAEPFRLVGARWMTDAAAIARAMNRKGLSGVRFEAVTRRIAAGQKFGGTTIPMVRIVITDRNAVRSSEIGAHLLREIYSRHPRAVRFQARGLEELSGSRGPRNSSAPQRSSGCTEVGIFFEGAPLSHTQTRELRHRLVSFQCFLMLRPTTTVMLSSPPPSSASCRSASHACRADAMFARRSRI